ncbi:MAG: hypothetical protein QM690_18095 [Sphingobium sp.]
MIEKNAPYHPGLAAIAAVLALSATPVIAQVTLPADPAPASPVAASPAAPSVPAPAAAAPAPAAPIQTVQSVPVTPKLPDIAVPETNAPRAATAARTTARAAESALAEPTRSPARSAEASPRAATPAPMAERQAAPAPAAAPAMAPAESAATEAPSPAVAAPPAETRASSEDMGYAGWMLLGGGLLLVAGGAAFALSRRPKRREEADGHVAAWASMAPSPVAAGTASAAAAPAQTVTRAPVHDPVPPRRAVMAPHRIAQTAGHGELAPDQRKAVLEAMVAEAPSEANPFHSRRNRLRRADFLLRTGQAEPRHGEYVVREERQPEMAGAQADRWSEMRFQGRQKTSVNWKPARR